MYILRFTKLSYCFLFRVNRTTTSWVLAWKSGPIKWKLIPTHETAPLFLYRPIKLATYSWSFGVTRKAGWRAVLLPSYLWPNLNCVLLFQYQPCSDSVTCQNDTGLECPDDGQYCEPIEVSHCHYKRDSCSFFSLWTTYLLKSTRFFNSYLKIAYFATRC